MFSVKDAQKIISENNPNGYYETYKKYEELYWKYIPNWIRRYSKTKKVKNVLDLGIAYGTLGIFTKMNTECNLYGVDFIKYMSEELIENYNINYSIKNIELDELNFNVKFDIIIFTECFEHLNFNPIPTLNKIKNLLTDDGVLMFSTPDSDSSWGKLSKYKTYKDIPLPNEQSEILDKHIYQYNLTELREIFDEVGLNIQKTYYTESGKNVMHFIIQLSKNSKGGSELE